MTVFISLFLLMGTAQGSFYGEHAKGWFWYNDPVVIEDEPAAAGDSVSKPSFTEALESYKKDLVDKKNLALMHPTVENVTNYMYAQKEMMARAERFSEVWTKIVLTTPELNYERIYSTAQYARHAQEDMQRLQMEARIKAMAKTHGLFYFFKSTCSHCKAFSPVVKAFADKYGWDVMEILLDDGVNAQFASALDIKAVPALVAFDATTQEMIPISYAGVSLHQLEENLMLLIASEKE